MSIKYIYTITIIGLMTCFWSSARAGICSKWSSKEIGVLDHTLINEASGLAISKQYPDRLYHINDSGDGPHLYISDINGDNARKVVIENFTPHDVEDIGFGPCGNGKTCIFIGDIGDNPVVRPEVKIVVIEEVENFGDQVTPKAIITAKYPDGPHNAEGMAIHPNGDLFIITKETDYIDRRAMPAKLFRLNAGQLTGENSGLQEFHHLGDIDFPWALYNYNLFGRIITAFDISPDGRHAIVLTYQVAVEMDLDLTVGSVRSMREMEEGTEYQIIEVPNLPQQEAISYLPDENSFLYTTEYHQSAGPAKIIKVSCQD
jgi:hypothetical protein